MKKVSNEELEWLIYKEALKILIEREKKGPTGPSGLCRLLLAAEDKVLTSNDYGSITSFVPNFNIMDAVRKGFLSLDNCDDGFNSIEELRNNVDCYWWKPGLWEPKARLGFLIYLYTKMCYELKKPLLTNTESYRVLKQMLKIHKRDNNGLCCYMATIAGALKEVEDKTFEDIILQQKLLTILQNRLKTTKGLAYPKLVSFLGGNIERTYWWKFKSEGRGRYIKILIAYYRIKMLVKA